MRKLSLLFLALLTCVCSQAQTDITTMNPSGVWTLAGSPYRIWTYMTIQSNNSLVIEPGVEVVFMGPYFLNVSQGAVLNAVGTPEQPITFRANDTTNWWNESDSAGGWNGIRYNDWNYSGTDWSAFQHCIVKDVKQCGMWSSWSNYTFRSTRSFPIKNCRFTHNQSQGSNGSGVIVLIDNSAAPIVVDSCEFSGNYATFATLQVGGQPADPHLIKRSNFHHNGGAGGTIWLSAARADIEDCELHYNTAQNNMGPIVSYGNYVNIRRNRIHHNTTDRQAAISAISGRMDIDNNLICNNSHTMSVCAYAEGGGGIDVTFNNNPDLKDSTYYRIRNNVIANNYSPYTGGGIFMHHCKGLIANNTIVNNKSANGGGLTLWNDQTDVTVVNNIFYGNTNADGVTGLAQSADVYLLSNVILHLDYNWMETPVAQAILPAITGGATTTGDTSHNIVGSNPGLMAPSTGAGIDYDATTANFSLVPSSPCINNGDEVNSQPTVTDYENTARMEGIIDRGAYEYGKAASQGILALSSGSLARLQAYPNPAAGRFYVSLPEAGGTLALTDGTGRVVLQTPVSGTTQAVDIASLPAGLYIVQWLLEGRVMAAGKVNLR